MANKPAPSLADLADVLSKLESPAEIERFLQDLLTPAEIQAVTERWAIVRMLASGMTQREVALSLDVSVTTVTRGNRQLQHGAGGFTHALGLVAPDADLAARRSGRGNVRPGKKG
jgi:Trp operon repressor